MRSIVAPTALALLWSMLVRVECHARSRVLIISHGVPWEATPLTRLVLHSVPSQTMHSHGSRHILVFVLDGLSRLFAAPRFNPM